jgi:hypothetical protein
MYNLSQSNGISMPFQSFALAGLGAATTHSHAASLVFAINGVIGTSPTGTTTPTTNSSARDVGSVGGAAAAGAALSVTAPALSTQFRGALVLWTIDAAGTKRIRSRGFFESNGDPLALEFPDVPPTEIPVAYHTLKAISTLSGTWTYGGSNFTGVTGMTTGTVVNLVSLPTGTANRVILT